MNFNNVTTILLVLLLSGKTSSSANLPNHKNLYQFGYTVNDENTKDFKTHQEVHDGKQVRGMYSLMEPNGDMRVVTYTADGTNGFKANVKVHPVETPELPTFFTNSKQEKVEQTKSDIGSTETTLNQSNNKNDSIETNTTLLPGFSDTTQTYDIDSSKLEANLKGENLKQKIKTEQISQDTIKPNKETRLHDVVDDNDEVMILDNDYKPRSENKEDHGLELSFFRQSLHSPSQEAKVIPVKIQNDPSNTDSELSESESNIETSNINYSSMNGNIYSKNNSIQTVEEIDSITTLYDENSYSQDSSNITQIEVLDLDLLKETTKMNNSQTGSMNQNEMDIVNSLDLETATKTGTNTNTKILTNNENKFSTINQEVDKIRSTTENTLVLTKPTIKTLIGNQESSVKIHIQHNYDKIITKKPDVMHTEKIKTITNETAVQTSLINQSNENSQSENSDQFKQNQIPIILTTLLVPYNIKFTCAPSISTNGGIKTTTLPNKSNQPVLQNEQTTMRPVFTTSLPTPAYPFQLLYLSPVLSQFNTKTAVPRPFSIYNDGLPTAPPQRVTYSYIDPTTLTPNLGYSSTQGQTHPYHKVSHYILPPPWAAHPVRSSHIPHHRQMPIFVLPMSHNSNYAPTFNPRDYEQLNQ